jgi:hypothetical protein
MISFGSNKGNIQYIPKIFREMICEEEESFLSMAASGFIQWLLKWDIFFKLI